MIALALIIILCITSESAIAQNQTPILIGITSDATGIYADSGASDRRGIYMAVAEFNHKGGVLGRIIKTLHLDTETNPDTGSRIARKLIEQHKVAFLIGAVHSGVSAAISQVAQEYGVIFLNTNSSSPTESGVNCHRTKFVWDGNGTNFSRAVVRNAVRWVGKRWMLMTHDYEWGRSTSNATRRELMKAGGTIIDELFVPVGTQEFASYLEIIQKLKPNVVAAAVGGDDMKALQAQIQDAGTDRNPAWLNNQQDWPDVWLRGGKGLFGIFGTTWYHQLDIPGVSELVKRYQISYPDAPIPVPGNVFYNGYMATRSLLEAIERVGTTNNHAIIREMENLKLSASERLQHDVGYMNPKTHQFQQTIYMATANPQPSNETDLYTILSHVSPAEVDDVAAMKLCVLEPMADTPVYEP